jgi:hypothetical protein
LSAGEESIVELEAAEKLRIEDAFVIPHVSEQSAELRLSWVGAAGSSPLRRVGSNLAHIESSVAIPQLHSRSVETSMGSEPEFDSGETQGKDARRIAGGIQSFSRHCASEPVKN